MQGKQGHRGPGEVLDEEDTGVELELLDELWLERLEDVFELLDELKLDWLEAEGEFELDKLEDESGIRDEDWLDKLADEFELPEEIEFDWPEAELVPAGAFELDELEGEVDSEAEIWLDWFDELLVSGLPEDDEAGRSDELPLGKAMGICDEFDEEDMDESEDMESSDVRVRKLLFESNGIKTESNRSAKNWPHKLGAAGCGYF